MKKLALLVALPFITATSAWAETAKPEAKPETKFELVIKDHQFSPSTLEIPAGQKVKLIIKNQDSSAEEFESTQLNREKVISGNSEAIVFVGPLDAGEYSFFGEFNPKTAHGKLIAK